MHLVYKKATYSGRAYKTETFKSMHWKNIIQLRIKWTIDKVTKYHSKLQCIFNMDFILPLKLVRDDALRMGIGIEFPSLGAVYEYDLLNKQERGLGTSNVPLTDDRSVRLWVSATGFNKFLGVKLSIA